MWGMMPCILSLFVSKSDAKEIRGAVQWLVAVYEDYRNRVVNRTVGYKAFLEENIVRLSMPVFLEEGASYNDLLQESIDRDKVKHILENRKFTEGHFVSDSFEEADAIRMIAEYNAIGIEEADISAKCLAPLSDYPDEVKEGLATVFRKYKLLCPDISYSELVALLTTGNPVRQYSIPPLTKNHDVGLVIFILFSAGALSRNWASVICEHGKLYTSSGTRMKRKNISAAMHRFDGCKFAFLDERYRDIANDVISVLSVVPGAKKSLGL
jgi:hypothetical protein